MRRIRSLRVLLAMLFFVVGCRAFAQEAVVSTMKNVSAYFDYYGYSLRPAGTTVTPGDYGPTQLFEIVRPSYGSFSIGRIYTSCTCIQVTADKKTFAAGETAVLTVRNILPTSGNTYPFYVQVTSPVRATLRYDTYVISDRYSGASANIAAIVEPTAVSEPVRSDSIEIIVPQYEQATQEKIAEEKADAPTEAPGSPASDDATPDSGQELVDDKSGTAAEDAAPDAEQPSES